MLKEIMDQNLGQALTKCALMDEFIGQISNLAWPGN